MDVPLIVILGAGASRASANYGDHLRPPLTIDLFDEAQYEDLLRVYDLAHQAGRFISGARKENTTLGLEKSLYGLQTSEHAHHRHMALAIPPYLQHLLHAVSEAHYSDAFRYDQLIERLLRLPYVCFLTLNYDLLLDRRLNGHHRLTTMDDYISQDKNWSLVKLHGSVNWFHKTENAYVPSTPPRDLTWNSEAYECMPPDEPLETVRGGSPRDLTFSYPALAIPEGPNDRLVLPTKHVWFLRNRFRGKNIDVLSIGYSGLDNEALKLMASLQCTIRRMTVVDHGLEQARAVFERFREAGLDAVWANVEGRDFAKWVDQGGLNRLIEEYGGPYADS